MKAFVFTDESLARHAGRFVWLSIDAEKEENAAFVDAYPIEGYPTLFVVDPRTEKPALRWLGSVTVAQLGKLLTDGELAVKGGGGALEERLAQADRAYAQKELAQAVTLLQGVLKDAPPDWPSRPRAVETTLYALSGEQRNAECVELAEAELVRLGRTPSFANAAAVGLSCALALPEDAREKAVHVAGLERAVREALSSDIQMAADDRSGLYATLLDARENAQDEAGAKQVAAQWAAFLDAEAAKAKTPEQRNVFDAHRMTAYLYLEQADRAIPMLEQSEREFPEDYNPPARLAVIYRTLKRFPEALAASERALAKAYGPRRMRVYLERFETMKAMGDVEGARKVADEAIAYAQALPESQRPARMIASFEKKRAELK